MSMGIVALTRPWYRRGQMHVSLIDQYLRYHCGQMVIRRAMARERASLDARSIGVARI